MWPHLILVPSTWGSSSFSDLGEQRLADPSFHPQNHRRTTCCPINLFEVIGHMTQETHPECSPHRQALVSPSLPWSGAGACSSPQVGCQPGAFVGLGKRALRQSPLPTQENGHSPAHVMAFGSIHPSISRLNRSLSKKEATGIRWP